MRFYLNLLIFVLLAGTFSSCVSKKKYDELAASKAATDAQLSETQSDLRELQSEKDALAAQMESETNRLNGELSNLRDEMSSQAGQITDLNTRLTATEAELEAARNMVADLFNGYQAAGLTVEKSNGRLVVATDTPFNFRSGSAYLSRAERNAIDEMAEQLQNSNVELFIVGHADTQKGMDNWDLSYRRAKAVAARLIRGGMNPENITVGGAGEYEPIGDNSTPEGRAKNRRTEIRPNPSLAPLMDGGK